MDIRNSLDVNKKQFGAKAGFFIFAAYLFTEFITTVFVEITSSAFFEIYNIQSSDMFGIRIPILITLVSFVTFIVIFELIKPYFSGSIRSGAYDELGFIRSSYKWYWWGGGVGALLSLLYIFIIVPSFPPADDYVLGTINKAIQIGGWTKFVIALNLIFLSPIGEEFLYRGVLYHGFTRSFGKVIAAVLVTVLFVLMHISEFGSYFISLSAIFFLSVGTLIIRELSKSIWPAVLLHSVYNFFQVLGAYLIS